MTSNQENKRTMFLAVKAVLLAFQSVWTANANFTTNYQAFVKLLDRLDVLRNQQEMHTKGAAEDKKAKRLLLIPELLRFMAAIKSLASDLGNNTLYEQAHYPKSKLLSVRDSIFIDICTLIEGLANDNAAALVPYGIAAADTTQLGTDRDDFATANPQPRVMKTVTKDATTQIKGIVTTIMSHLKKKMDNLVATYSGTNDDFVAQYFTARIIIDANGTSPGLKGTIRETVTGRRLKGVTVVLEELGMSHVTNGRGNYRFKKVPPGTYTLHVSKTGYLPASFPHVLVVENHLLTHHAVIAHDPAFTPGKPVIN